MCAPELPPQLDLCLTRYYLVSIIYLLQKYENLLTRQFHNDPSNFNLTFKLYLSLLETFFNLFNLYKDNFIRRDKIPAIIDIIIESINSLKVLMIVSPSNIKDLGIFQGKLLLEYANFLYIDVDNENELIEQYKFIIHKQIDGYFLLTNFCDDISEYEDLYIENVSRAILLLLMKLNKLESYDFSNLDYIMYIYNTDVKNNENSFYDEESFKNELFNNYSLIFNKKENLDILSITKKIVTSDITNKNLRILHDIVLYNDNLEKDDYITVFESLLSSDDLDNNINECMKLKIIDLIIHKFINKKMYEEFLPYSLKLKEYLSRKEIKSYKIFYFSKLHLSLSYFYSFLNNEYIPLIEEEYHLSEQISTFSFIKEHNKKLFKKILLNYSKEHFSLISEDCDFSYNKLLLIADILMKNAFIKEEIKAQYKVEEIKPKLINMILNKPSVNNFTLEKDLSKEINSNIFFNKEEFLVLGKTKEIKEDYELYDESIFDDYNIFVKINNDKINNDITKNYVLNQIKSISIAF